jgi:hypothetical protein
LKWTLIFFDKNIFAKMQKENNEQTMLKMGEFVSVASQLAYSACEIIKEAS